MGLLTREESIMTNTSIVQELPLDAPRHKVFRAITNAAELDRWWTTRAESQPRQNGRFRYEWTFAKQPERNHLQEGTYSAYSEPERVAYPWKVGPAPTKVEFTLEEKDGRTLLRLSHEGWGDGMDEAKGHHEQGWSFFLGNLRSVLEEGVDRRAEVLGMEVRD
jgi:uncharacterized protein YndB with AHSA1/START domain